MALLQSPASWYLTGCASLEGCVQDPAKDLSRQGTGLRNVLKQHESTFLENVALMKCICEEHSRKWRASVTASRSTHLANSACISGATGNLSTTDWQEGVISYLCRSNSPPAKLSTHPFHAQSWGFNYILYSGCVTTTQLFLKWKAAPAGCKFHQISFSCLSRHSR